GVPMRSLLAESRPKPVLPCNHHRRTQRYSEQQGSSTVNTPLERDTASSACYDCSLFLERLDTLSEQIRSLQEQLQGGECDELESISVQQAAARLSRAPFTIRQWCRTGRIGCHRAQSGRGPYAEWRIPIESIRYYQVHGLLPTTTQFT